MKQCVKCAAQLNDNATSCPNCGAEQPGQRQKVKFVLGIPVMVNGLLAVILGLIGKIKQETTKYTYIASNPQAVKSMRSAGNRFLGLFIIGLLLIAAGVVAGKFLEKYTQDNPLMKKIVWLAPLAVIVLFTIINFIPILSFKG